MFATCFRCFLPPPFSEKDDGARFDAEESVASYTFRLADYDNNKFIEAVEFAAFSFMVRYAKENKITIPREELVLPPGPDVQDEKCDHLCQLFAIFHSPIVSLPAQKDTDPLYPVTESAHLLDGTMQNRDM